jgi:hypothetical protein
LPPGCSIQVLKSEVQAWRWPNAVTMRMGSVMFHRIVEILRRVGRDRERRELRHFESLDVVGFDRGVCLPPQLRPGFLEELLEDDAVQHPRRARMHEASG